jgi:hypothetical protein
MRNWNVCSINSLNTISELYYETSMPKCVGKKYLKQQLAMKVCMTLIIT